MTYFNLETIMSSGESRLIKKRRSKLAQLDAKLNGKLDGNKQNSSQD